jgi:hypothetical protein
MKKRDPKPPRWSPSTRPRHPARQAPGALILAGAVFAAIGIGILANHGGELSLYWDSGAWETVPATIREVAYRTEYIRDQPGHTRVVHWVTAKYDYSFGGREYVGTRVELFDEKSSDRSFLHERRERILLSHRDRGEPFPALVDPSEPANATLFREPTAFLYVLGAMGGGFTLLGLVPLFLGVAGFIGESRRKMRQSANRRKPWLARPEWAAGTVRSDAARRLTSMWGLTILIGVVFAAFLPILVRVNVPRLGWWIFSVATLGFWVPLGIAVFKTARIVRFGRPVLSLDAVPASPGGELVGTVAFRRVIDPADGFEMTLLCSRDREQSGREDRLVLSERVKGVPAAGHTELPVRIAIPERAPQTGHPSPYWELEVRARFPGPDLVERFPVPVFDQRE